MLKLIVVFLFSYLFGSIPFSYLIGKYIKKIDLKKIGSRNPGGSNLFSNTNLFWGLIGALLDIGKGIFLVIIGKYLKFDGLSINTLIIGTIVGHCWSLFLNFKGGRGVAASIGTLLFVYPQNFGFGFAVGLLVTLLNLFKIHTLSSFILDTSLGTFVGYLVFILASLVNKQENSLLISLIVFVLIIIRRVTEDLSEYRGKGRFKIFLIRLFYDRNSYYKVPYKFK
ncbi:hypothetical protein COS81_03330 [candidate division WWE3 bacterium CG06_land_8_20_14_3_00_42_16]|uniref:Glycerol-3-phosphate acyltransferase n=4 Tax=Katanobacteria TaxID=422282 RepID=A0A2M7AMI6_UNCKA|nr:MAG: hypothetical protein COS81_03330 [candidate division WWE3 bacterium CG06_land_8_20_14_3_00_42_16]PIZ43858.1 MAG: hypothetical protein COY34_00205 [candidate division WWE3 bacterium CG_4_10_14_0_2_um_filter_42_8]PJA37627.1 MAG: hypothetical protein CO181_02745 [candidate division WWE3 bacterium CG_4_9_14_3_um_filter_43_9]PJC67987.1 MAG: hypothetical protein CO015_05645 [candidate division WWE3 bacterium CG_4_8_14_3_um_filter_42_11]